MPIISLGWFGNAGSLGRDLHLLPGKSSPDLARMPGPARELHGRILVGASPYYLNEEEIPRAGKGVARAFRRARWLGGSTFVWIGRRVTSGRGEGGSGLAFDVVVDLGASQG